MRRILTQGERVMRTDETPLSRRTAVDLFSLADKVALVTGGSRGLGREMCKAFADAGANVIVASRKQDACDALAAELTAATGNEALGVECHVGRWSECDRLVDHAYQQFGRVDVL